MSEQSGGVVGGMTGAADTSMVRAVTGVLIPGAALAPTGVAFPDTADVAGMTPENSTPRFSRFCVIRSAGVVMKKWRGLTSGRTV